MNEVGEGIEEFSDLWRESFSKVQEDKGFRSKIPELELRGVDEIKAGYKEGSLEEASRVAYDTENFAVYLPEDPENNGEAIWSNPDFERLSERVASEIALSQLSEELEESKERIFDLYGAPQEDMEMIFEFSDIESGGLYDEGRRPEGWFDNPWETISLDYSLISHIDLETGELRGRPENRQTEVQGIIDHEISHAVKNELNPQDRVLSDHVSEKTDSKSEYKHDVNRASIEAISCFEQYLDQEDVNWYELGAVDAGIPERDALIHVLPQLMSSSRREDGLSYDNPYDLGKAVAFTADLALRRENGEEAGRELTRDYLKSITTTPAGLEGTIEKSLEKLGLPNIHEEVRSISDKLSNSENPYDVAIKELAKNREMYEDEELVFYRDMAVSKAMEWETGDPSIPTPDLDNPYTTY